MKKIPRAPPFLLFFISLFLLFFSADRLKYITNTFILAITVTKALLLLLFSVTESDLIDTAISPSRGRPFSAGTAGNAGSEGRGHRKSLPDRRNKR